MTAYYVVDEAAFRSAVVAQANVSEPAAAVESVPAGKNLPPLVRVISVEETDLFAVAPPGTRLAETSAVGVIVPSNVKTPIIEVQDAPEEAPAG